MYVWRKLYPSASVKPSSSYHLVCQPIPIMPSCLAPSQFRRKATRPQLKPKQEKERNTPKTFIQPPTRPIGISSLFILSARNRRIRMAGAELPAERVYHAGDKRVLRAYFVHHVAIFITTGRLGALRIVVVFVIAAATNGALPPRAAPRRLRCQSRRSSRFVAELRPARVGGGGSAPAIRPVRASAPYR